MNDAATHAPNGLPVEGTYTLHLSDGRTMVRPMGPDWVWDDTFSGAVIMCATNADGVEVYVR